MDRGNEGQVSASAPHIFGFTFVVNGKGNGQAAIASGIVEQVRQHLFSQFNRTRDGQHEPSFVCDTGHFQSKLQPLGIAQAMVAEDDPTIAGRKTVDGLPKPVAEPFVGHQPPPRP